MPHAPKPLSGAYLMRDGDALGRDAHAAFDIRSRDGGVTAASQPSACPLTEVHPAPPNGRKD